MKVTLIIPTLNEIGGMKIIMPRIKREWVDQILFIDGGSTDGTIEYARENGYSIVIQKKYGLRNAYVEALEHAEGDVIITFSPDGNSIPELIPVLIEKMREGYDMVIASRYAEGAKSYDDDLITSFGNWVYITLINLLYGSSYTDIAVMFRAWKKEIFYQLELGEDYTYAFEERIFNKEVGGIEPLLCIRAAKRKLKCVDIPGDEPARLSGVRKLHILRWGATHFIQIFKDKLFWR